MPSSKGGKEFAEQEFRYTISELTRAKLNGFYREAIDSLFKNFQIKFWLQVCSTLYKWRRVNVSVCACTCGREPAGTWLNYECKWAWILPTVRSVSQWTCFPFFTHPFCSSFFFIQTDTISPSSSPPPPPPPIDQRLLEVMRPVAIFCHSQSVFSIWS